MGNLHDTLKNQGNFGNSDKEFQDMLKNKSNDVFSEFDDPEYFKTPPNTILGQLFSWSLSEIKIMYDKYRRYTHFPLMDRTMFCKIMPFSKRNSNFLFETLTKQGHPQYLPFFEILCMLILAAYANSRNKIKMLFNMLDTPGNGSMPFPQWHTWVLSFIHGYCRLVNKPFPKRSKIERVAKLIFIKIDVAPYNNALDHGEILDWVEGTPHLVALFTRFEPAFTIKEKPNVFFSIKRYTDKQIDEIAETVLNYGTTGEDSPSKIQELLQKSTRGDVYQKNQLFQNSHRRSSVVSDTSNDSDAHGSSASPPPHSKFDFITEKNHKTSKFRSENESSTLPPVKKSIPPIQINNQQPYQRGFMSPKTQTASMSMLPRTQTLPKIKTEREIDKEELIQKRKELMAKSRSAVKRNVIITGGRSFTRSDILNLRYYFDAIADGDDVMTLKDFIKSFAKNASLQKVSASLFNFLDSKAKGYITFPELVNKLYPGMKSDQLKLALEWSMEEENLEKSGGQRKYIEETQKLKKGGSGSPEKLKKNPVPKEGVKKLRYMFELYDDERKGFISLDNLKFHLGAIFSSQELDDTFRDLDKDQDGKLNFKEFIDMILPNDFYVDNKYLGDQKAAL